MLSTENKQGDRNKYDNYSVMSVICEIYRHHIYHSTERVTVKFEAKYRMYVIKITKF